MPIETDLYDILGVETSVDHTQIKKAYHKLALKHHPDKGGDADKFKKISGAYEVLSDPEKRRLYDERGKEGLRDNIGVTSDNLSSLFGNLFGGNNIFNMFSTMRNAYMKTAPIIYNCSVSLEDICKRKTKKIKINRDRVCSCYKDCEKKICERCQGKGQTMTQKKHGNMVMMTTIQCQDCKGNGKTLFTCGSCKNGLVNDSKILEFTLCPEMVGGKKILFKEEGNQCIDKTPGDFVVNVDCAKHPKFSVEGKNLMYNQEITLKEALCGCDLTIDHPAGHKVLHSVFSIISPDTVITICGQGVDNDGIMKISFSIQFPKVLNKEQKEILKKTI